MNDSPSQGTAQESTTEQDSRHGFWWYIWLAFFVLVAYPLSIGPAARIHNTHPSSRKTIEAIYTPVVLLMHHSQPVDRFMKWYVLKVWKAD